MGLRDFLKRVFNRRYESDKEEFDQESARTDFLLDRVDIAGVESCFRTGLIDKEKAEKISALVKRLPSLVERVRDYLMHPESTEFPLYASDHKDSACWIQLAHDVGLSELAGCYRINSDLVVGSALCFIVNAGVFVEPASRAQAKAFADFARKQPEIAYVIKGLCENKMNLPGYDVCGLKPLLYIAEALGDKGLVQYVEARMEHT
jgi:hypothetical protein